MASAPGPGTDHYDSRWFNATTPAYLFATEYPFVYFQRQSLHRKRVLTIAGSGDIPLYLAASGAELVTAVDVSRAALQLCRLKQAAVGEFSREEFLWFFLAGIERAAPFLRRHGIDANFDRSRWQRLWTRLEAGELPPGAAEGTGAGGAPPFGAELRPTELWCLRQIPYLNDSHIYAAVKESRARVRWEQADIAAYLSSSARSWDFVYLSNLPEYVRAEGLLEGSHWRPRLQRLLLAAVDRLAAEGTLCWYVFHHPRAADAGLGFCEQVLEQRNLKLQRGLIEYRPDIQALGRFYNGLVWAAKPPTGGSDAGAMTPAREFCPR